MPGNQLLHLIKALISKGSIGFCGLVAFLGISIAVEGIVRPRPASPIAPQTEEVPQTCTELGPTSIGAAGRQQLFWKGKSELRVRFLNGSNAVQAQVRYYASIWNNYSGIQFVFVDSGHSDVRVSFTANGTSWAYIGNTAETIAQDEPTMNFGWFNEITTQPLEFRRVILHEFGHALGLIHEHQSPVAAINWNRPAVYQYYSEHFGWSHNKVNENIFRKYGSTLTQFTAYDPTSIMHYPIPPGFTTNGTNVDWNTNLSPSDKDFIKKVYP